VRAIIAKAEAEKTYAISDYSSYMQAARIGGNLAFGYCRGVLEEPLPDDYDPDVEHDMTGYRRAEAARALGVFGHPAALPLLDQKQTDPRESPGVRHCCKQAIQRINQLQIIYEIPE
jgi:HEAT repeat protein